jgi:hypothetical protein
MVICDTDNIKEEFEDTNGVIRICLSKKNRQHNGPKRKSTKGQATIYKPSHINIMYKVQD